MPAVTASRVNRSSQGVNRRLIVRPPSSMPAWFWSQIARLTRVELLDRWYRELSTDGTVLGFVESALQKLGGSYRLELTEIARVPSSGPLIVVANHPYGGLDGLAAISALLAHRSDLKVLATRLLTDMEALRPVLIPVDNFSGGRGSAGNVRSMRAALRHVKAGGAILMFPAGEVAHVDLRAGCVIDPPWHRGALRFIELARASIVPLYVHGSNGFGFQLAGLLHPALRTALLPTEVINKRGYRLDLRWGVPISGERICALASRGDLGRQLRARVYALAAPRPSASYALGGATLQLINRDGSRVPVIAQGDPLDLAKEYARLTAQRLVKVGGLDVLCVTSREAPLLCREISRLRELSFRAVGEGTGAGCDWDQYDEYYEHLIAWDTRKSAVAGGYRLARIDLIRKHYGRGSLYLESLFEFREPFFGLLGSAIELGRSFVTLEYQRTFAPLLALWRGIGEYVGRHPSYTRLLGPVSISADYDPAAREILLRYLRWHHFDPVLGALVKARAPVAPARETRSLGVELGGIKEIEAVTDLLEDVSGRSAGVPVLLRQYLRLGGRVLGFNVDVSFGNCLDCLTLVDLRKTPVSVLRRYMDPSRIG